MIPYSVITKNIETFSHHKESEGKDVEKKKEMP
jgi:hypothetical protein